ncbi:MAG: biopolymer transporter ExbD [Polyangiaceae bacterium]|nr:biopolymer transporter ExbD [Polyangiaceae bacterium]
MAGGARDGDDDGLISEINVTPLVDVLLVLLIILMVTATAIVRESTIPVELPEAATGERSQEKPPTTLPVSISNDGKIYLEEEVLTLDQLRERAAAAHRADPQTRAILHADGRIAHAKVVQVIDALRQAEVTKFAINVRPSDLEAAPSPANAD